MKLVILQRCIKLKLISKKNINNDISKIEQIINDLSFILNNNYKNNIINVNELNLYFIKLEEINILFSSLPNPFSHFKKFSIKKIRKKLNSIIDKINGLVADTGTNLKDIIYLSSGLKINNNYTDFINTIFKPFNYKIYKINIKYNFANKKECIEIYDQKNINIIKKYTDSSIIYNFFDLYKKQVIIDYTNGARLYYFLKQKNLVVVCDGYFMEDPINNYKNSYIFADKFNNLKKKIKKLSLETKFKTDYFNQISLKDFIVNSNEQNIEKCIEGYNYLKEIKSEPISSLVKKFLSSENINQRNILILLLLESKDNNIQYLSYLLFDLINNDSFMLKSNPLSEEIYKSLHWNLKKKIKMNNTKYKKITDNVDFNEKDISYDKRIKLMNVDDNIKEKATVKYKEFLNKGSENGKAQQYLDGLLKIPFNIYRKEEIFTKLEYFLNQINLLSENKLKNRYDIDFFFNNVLEKENDQINNKINICLNSIDHKNYKLKEIKEIINNINSILETDIIYKNIKKEKLLKSIIDKVNNSISVVKRIEVLKIFNIKIDIFSDQTLNNLYKKWKEYNNNINDYINNTYKILDSAIYKQDDAKNEFVRLIGQWINGNMDGYCIGFEGPPGVGKTTLAQKGISRCLKDINNKDRPFSFIQIGGTSNGSLLDGHNYTYLGSKWGKIIDILMDTQCMNPIIYIDELDKISNTENGKELIGILTHITDSSQNTEFEDKYFYGIKIDLSKIIFIFSYNDPNLIDPILLDRIHRLKFSSLSKMNKLYIINNYLLPEIQTNIGLSKENIIFSKEILLYIIDNYTNESGIRKLKEKLYEIIREINIQNLTHKIEYPITIDIDILNKIFKNKQKMVRKKIYDKSYIGIVNGLYATSVGLGGITLIEVFKMFSERSYSLELTGQQGDVMKESMICSQTLAWNLIPSVIKTGIYKEWEKNKWGVHIHCPDTSTPKDGPSAGAAITLGLISLLTNIPVVNTIALTGEIDLKGNINKIGGLNSKIEGGKTAGVKLILYPESNNKDIEIIKNTEPYILENIMIKPVKTIWEVLEMCLVKNNLQFNRF